MTPAPTARSAGPEPSWRQRVRLPFRSSKARRHCVAGVPEVAHRQPVQIRYREVRRCVSFRAAGLGCIAGGRWRLTRSRSPAPARLLRPDIYAGGYGQRCSQGVPAPPLQTAEVAGASLGCCCGQDRGTWLGPVASLRRAESNWWSETTGAAGRASTGRWGPPLGRPVERGLSAVWDLPTEVRLCLRQGPTDDQVRVGGRSAAGRERRPEEDEGDLGSRPVRAPAGWWPLDGVGAPGRW